MGYVTIKSNNKHFQLKLNRCRIFVAGVRLMSNGMIKTAVREIKGSLGRYMAILAIVMLGAGLFVGLKATTPAMIVTENDYLAEQDFFDFQLLSTVGFDEGAVAEVAALNEIADVEGAVSVDALCSFGEGNESAYKIHTIPERINRIVVTAGRLPETADECLLDAAAYGEDVIGSQITVTDSNEEDTLEMFRERTFTAVGIVRSPYYINFERGTTSIGDGKITAFLYVPKEAFDCDYLTEIYATTKLKYKVYTDEYDSYIDGLQGKMEDTVHELTVERYDRVIAEAQEKIEDAQTELDDKKAEAREELDDAWQKILDGEQELVDGEQEIRDAEKEIADGEREIAEGEQELIDGEQEIADGEREIAEKEPELLDAEKEVSYHEWEVFANGQELLIARDKLEQGKRELEEKANLLHEQEVQVLEKEAELLEQEAQLRAQLEALPGQKKALEQKEAEITSGMEQLEQWYAYALSQAPDEETKNAITAEYEQKKAELTAALAQISSAKKEIEKGISQLQSGLAQIQSGLAQIQAGKGEFEEGKRQITEAGAEISFQEKQLLEAEEKLMSAEEQVKQARNELEEGKAELAQAKLDLEEGRAELEQGRADLAQARIDLADARVQLEEGKADLEEGKTELADARIEYADAEAEFEEEVADAQHKIDDAREELAEIEEPDDYVLTRDTNIGYACYESDSNIVAAIANVFPVFFFLVAALICMTTMNRMVEEQRTQIGVLKALGYGNAAIMGKYLFYAGSAATVGAVLGCAVGTWLFPRVIWMGYGIMYSMGDIQYYFDIPMSLLSLVAALLCSMGAAYFSCRHELLGVPASLIRPKSPRSGKRIFLEKIPMIWSRLKFLHKVSIRNIVRYKKRFFMIILGVSGCTALLLTGFGVKDSVMNVADMQYDEVQIYDIGITYSEGIQEADREEMVRKAGDILAQTAYHYEESVELDFGGRTKSIYLEVPEDAEEMGAFLNLHTTDGEPLAYPEEGEAVLTEKVARNMGIKVGDQVVFRDNDRNSFTVRIAGLCENFVYNYIYISKETYIGQRGAVPEYKGAYTVVRDGVDVHEAAAVLSDMDNVLAVFVTADMRQRIVTMMDSMDYIVFLIIACAGCLAFIVLYNLTNINITERIREIATIKVLGFYARETADYVFRENLLLTCMGAVVGLGLGKWLHSFVMYNINIDMISFKTTIAPVSYVWSFLLTFVFAMLVNGVMYFKLEKINMAESLKSIE